MMGRKRFVVPTVIFAAVLVLCFAYYYGVIREKPKGDPPVYSVILYQHSNDQWESLMEGIDQAEDDCDVNVRYVTMEDDWDAQDQIEMIKREIDAGASGILLAAVDSERIGNYLEETDTQIPVITVETGVDKGEVLAHISGDNYQMGRILGEKILSDMEAEDGPREVTVVGEYMERDSVKQRYEGLRDVLEEASEKVTINTIARSKGDFSLSLFIETAFPTSGPYIAALDKFCTQEAAAAWENARTAYEGTGVEFHIYGIGNTAQTVNDLDNEKLKALVFQNEFNMGYEGIQALCDKEKKGYIKSDLTIREWLVTRDTLYDTENERLLFPSI